MPDAKEIFPSVISGARAIGSSALLQSVRKPDTLSAFVTFTGQSKKVSRQCTEWITQVYPCTEATERSPMDIWGLFDRASSSWNNLKCQLDATR